MSGSAVSGMLLTYFGFSFRTCKTCIEMKAMFGYCCLAYLSCKEENISKTISKVDILHSTGVDVQASGFVR